MGKIRSHMTYANVMATMAMALALGGGTAMALAGRNTVNSGDIINGEVKSKDAKDNGLRGKDIRDGSLAAKDLGTVVTGSFDHAGIAAESCVNSLENFTVSGADDNDMWLVTPTGTGVPEANYDVNGELIMLGIPHEGEGHIKVCNVSGGAIDPGSVSYMAVLIDG